jgi:uncharacterized coiled-coil protein SlyX
MSAEEVVDLEIKIAFQEKWIAELDEVVRTLRDEVDALRAEVRSLTEQVTAAGAPTPHEKPPHY